MKRSILLETFLILTFLVVATGVIAFTGADLTVSAPFYREGSWPVGDRFFWHLLYRLDRIPSISLGIVGLFLFVMSYVRYKYYRWRRAGVFLVILLILGPGFLVNSVFKNHWGRPRPREIVEFGGKKQFLNPWQIGDSSNGHSFPSGHSAAAFYMAAPYFIYRRSDKRRAYIWLSCGMMFGIIMSIARITQGAHFLSDTLWAFGMVALTALPLATLLNLDEAAVAPQVLKE